MPRDRTAENVRPRPRAALALLLGAATLGPLGACSGAQDAHASAARPRTARDYFPLHAHAAWSFDLHDLDHREAPPGLVTLRVVRDDGAGGFYLSQGRGAPAVYEYSSEGLTRNGEPILQQPLVAGTRWRGTGGDSYEIRAVDLTRTVPAGTFHHVIEVVRFAGDATLANGTEFRETNYYAPGVGPIETTLPLLLTPGDVRHYRLVLRGYTLDGDL